MDFLGIDGIKTLDVTYNPKGIRVLAELQTTPTCCPHCGRLPWELKPHGTKRQIITDLHVRENAVEIELIRRRYFCMKCKRTSLQPLSGIDERRSCAIRLIEHIERQSLLKPFSHVAQETGLADTTVRAIFNEYILRLSKSTHIETPRVLGLDGVYIRKKERLILTDIEHLRVIELIESIKERSVAQALFDLPDRRHVEVVTLDMSASLRRAVKHALPWAFIVVDRFHIQRMDNQAVDSIRRHLHASMSSYDRRLIMRDPRYLRKHRDQLKKMGKLATLEEWLDKLPLLRTAYDLKEGFFGVWFSSCSQTARQRYEDWEKTILGCPSEHNELICHAFGPLLKAMRNWGTEVFNFFDYPYTNAYTESANNIVKTIQRDGRRYSFWTIRAKVIHGGLLKASKTTLNS
jgi:transposase